jgi:hypothetical protein
MTIVDLPNSRSSSRALQMEIDIKEDVPTRTASVTCSQLGNKMFSIKDNDNMGLWYL